jgi:hypothetical protein
VSEAYLKDWLHQRGLTQTDQLLLVLASFDCPVPLKEVLDRAENAGLKRRKFSNPSATLSRTRGLAVHNSLGWEITAAGRRALAERGFSTDNPAHVEVAIDLRRYLAGLNDETVKSFLDETIHCFELGLHRSAVVMSWLAAIYILQREVLANHLAAFNAEMSRIKSDWKPARSADDFGPVKESDFLDRLVAISVIGKNVKTELKQCLDRRNACGHPNSYRLGKNAVAHHIETLLLNVFSKFGSSPI